MDSLRQREREREWARERADSLRNPPHIKHLFWGHSATDTGLGVPFIAAICFSQHTVIALCSSIDFVLNPGLSRILTASTFGSPLHLLRLTLPPSHPPHPPHPHVQSPHIDRYTLWLWKYLFFSHSRLKNISGQWLMNSSQQLGYCAKVLMASALGHFIKQWGKIPVAHQLIA